MATTMRRTKGGGGGGGGGRRGGTSERVVGGGRGGAAKCFEPTGPLDGPRKTVPFQFRNQKLSKKKNQKSEA